MEWLVDIDPYVKALAEYVRSNPLTFGILFGALKVWTRVSPYKYAKIKGWFK